MKKSILLILCCIVFLSTLVFAQGEKIDVSIDESFAANENISLKVVLLDFQNKEINADLVVIFEDENKITSIEKTIPSNQEVTLSLGENPLMGFWTVTAKYQGLERKTRFSILENEQAKFELNKDTLTVTNIGNTRYVKTAQILIGDTVVPKNLDLDIGGKTDFRLIAPDGVYNIKVSIGGETILIKNNVALTGRVTGILDKGLTDNSGITSGGNEFGISNKKRNFVYIFIVVIFGTLILLTIERRYRNKGMKTQAVLQE